MRHIGPWRHPHFVAVAAAAILAVVFLQTLGKTSVRDDYDMPPVASGR
jgi:hypothetical protein